MQNLRFELLWRINRIISTLDSFKSESIKTQKLLFSDCFKNESVFKEYKTRINNIMAEYDHGNVPDEAIENILDNLCVGFLYDEINIKYVPIFIGDKVNVFYKNNQKSTCEVEIIKHDGTRFNETIILNIDCKNLRSQISN